MAHTLGSRSGRGALLLLYTLSFPSKIRKEYNAETYFPAEQPPPRQDARFSDPHEDRRWTGSYFPPPRNRPQKADRQLREVAGSRTFPLASALTAPNLAALILMDLLFPKVYGSCDPAISARFTTTVRVTRARTLPRFASRIRRVPVHGWDSLHRERWAKPSSAIACAAACGKRSGLSWLH